MELAINMFNGGLVLDSHPLVQGSDTLSDALNATYITMNGNEVVLQNDMGNRRVDNAYLPAGYEPVGIKEHGGIIYIASYNPITHRCQIGSFPSPERNMGIEYEDNGTEFNFTDFLSKNNIVTKNGIKFLKDDILLYPLTKDTSLHAGDKFTVYSGDIWNLSQLITNFGTSSQVYNKTPFNSYFTLSLGIINSLNEFSDITSSLERFDEKGNIIKGLDSSETKFNTGYFIAPSNWKTVNGGLIGQDAALYNEREKIGANTYAYKLTGPLYLKAQLNHIQTFSYSINASKIHLPGVSAVRLHVTGTAVYNCPDDLTGNFFDSFNLFYKPLGQNSSDYSRRAALLSVEKGERIFDLVTNTYSSTITKHYVIPVNNQVLNDGDVLIEYLIAVPVFHPTEDPILGMLNVEKNIYLSNLSEHGSLHFSKIGINSCKLNTWRYKNKVKDNKVVSTVLDYGFECYTDSVTSYILNKITLKNLTTNSNDEILLVGEGGASEIPSTTINNGILQVLIDWTDVKLLHRNLYEVSINYSRSDSTDSTDEIVVKRFILGTELFNECYSFVPDFGIFMGKASENDYVYGNTKISRNESTDEIRNKYLNVSDKLDLIEAPKLKDVLSSQQTIGNNPINIYNPDLNLVYFSGQEWRRGIKIDCDKEWQIKDLKLYPSGVSPWTNDSDTTITASISTKSFTKKIASDDSAILAKSATFDSEVINYENLVMEGENISFDIILKDLIYFKYISDNRMIGQAYTNLVDTDETKFHNERILELLKNSLVYNGVKLTIDGTSPTTTGVVTCTKGNRIYDHNGTYTHNEGTDTWNTSQYYVAFKPYWKTSGDNMDSGKEIDELWEILKSSFLSKTNCPFTFMFNWEKYYYCPSIRETEVSGGPIYWPTSSSSLRANQYTRVWWLDEDGNPTLLNNFSNISTLEKINYSGLFSDRGYLTETEKRNAVYLQILKFIGRYQILGTFNKGYLVIPLENYLLQAWYPSNENYLYSEETKANLTVSIQYTLDREDNVIENNLNLLLFYTNREISITKKVEKEYTIDTRTSSSIYEISTLYDLSNYSIDLETGNILSKNNLLKCLYIRKRSDTSILKEVPENFPILLNTGTKYDFPVVCRKLYSQGTTIGNPFMAVPADFTQNSYGVNQVYKWIFSNTVGTNELNIKAVLKLDPTTQQIPVLYDSDLTLTEDFFNT